MKERFIYLRAIIILLFLPLTDIFPQNYGQWISADPTNLDRSDFASIVLPNGNVLVTGGQSYSTHTITNTCEIYNYKTNKWLAKTSTELRRFIIETNEYPI